MLLFITSQKIIHTLQFNFNTSHVTVYRSSVRAYAAHMSNFNTSHVTVYLSKCLFIFYFLSYFNTSHVTVYRCVAEGLVYQMLFQYISCYCLS